MERLLKQTHQETKINSAKDYQKFDKIDGSHSWKKQVPEGFVPYTVRRLNYGTVPYFNFNLAKEMGLIPANHPHKMNSSLQKKLIQTFSLRIINEYDIEKKIPYPEKDIVKNQYMATRYLQVQHKSRSGKTSGDGRSIWNGSLAHKGICWDISSRGTGVTKLSPGSATSEKNLKSGNTIHGYGCGLAEIDELYSSALLSEIFHNSDIRTERTLAIIDTGKGLGIGVRAGHNLFRPAHLFMYLKQERYDALKRATDFIIERQIKNGSWSFSTKSNMKYDYMLKEISDSFSKFSARLEREYIFTWMGWDGDNILASAGIIDYGSIRPFGLRHDNYRFDDPSYKISTTLTEQRREARLIVHIFAQMLNYLKTKKKTPAHKLKNHVVLKEFDKSFFTNILLEFLRQAGLNEDQRQFIFQKKKSLAKKFYKQFSYLEKVKTYKKAQKIIDGINRPPIFNARSLFRELTQTVSLGKEQGSRNISFNPLKIEDLQKLIASEFATKKDLRISPIRAAKLKEVQISYYKLVISLNTQEKFNLKKMQEECLQNNRKNRVTGNALCFIVSELMKNRKKGLDRDKAQKIIENFIIEQSPKKTETPKLNKNSSVSKISNTFLSIVEENFEEI